MSRILHYIIESLDAAKNLQIAQPQIDAGLEMNMRSVRSKVSFKLHGRKVEIEYIKDFPVTVSDGKGTVLYQIDGGRDLLAAIIARGDRKAIRDVFPAPSGASINAGSSSPCVCGQYPFPGGAVDPATMSRLRDDARYR